MAALPALKEKQVRIITIVLGSITALLVGVIGFQLVAGALVRAEDLSPKNLAITEITTSSSRVKWATDRETQSVIEYGTTPTQLTFFAPEATSSKEHSIELNLLNAGSTYYFQLRTGDKKFDNGGVPWTFTTASQNSAQGANPDTSPAESSSSGAILSPMPTNTPKPAALLSPLPTLATTPTSSPIAAKDTSCTQASYLSNLGTKNAQYDQDNNGIVNLLDWSLCNVKKNGLAPSSAPTSTPAPSLTPTPTPTITPGPSPTGTT
ncbi:MAG: fibronectin type III domain-containing protein [Patescibacteria group bacterium]|jgi:hypothetical protein